MPFFIESISSFTSTSVEWLNLSNLIMLAIRFSFNTGVLLLLVRWLYYSSSGRKDYLFTFFIIGTLIFLLCYVLGNVQLHMGFALGLFAIFGIIRYRTGQIQIKEMTYLFLVAAISAINALVDFETSIAEVLFVNAAVVFLVYGFEKRWLMKHESAKELVYEKIDLVKPDKRTELFEDLKTRTGIENIHRIEIGKIDFVRDICYIRIYYWEIGTHINMADNQSPPEKD